MKKITIFTSTALLLASLITTGYIVFKAQLRTNLALNTKVAIISEKIEKIQFNISDIYNNFMQKYKKMRRSILGEITKNPWYSPEKPVQQIVIHLKHGGMIAGKLLKKSRDKYIVEWKGEKIAIDAARVKRIERKTQKAVEWPYKNDVVVKRTNGIILDAKIVDVKKDSVTLLYLEGGGSLELDVNRSDIECLLFAPVYTRESQELETQLKRQFPKMEFYTEGNFTIITDSYSRTVSSYKRAIKNVYTNIYLKFFKLFNGRKPKRQNFVVVFDDFVDFAEYAITDGVPFWAVLGYFSPTDNVLYLFNAFGKRIEKMVFDVIVGKTGKTVDEIADEIKKRVDERYHMTIEGRVETVKDKYQAAYSMYRHYLTERTLSTLRHEFTHEVFHNWGLQGIIMSKPNINKRKLSEKKKEFLETEDCKKKEELLMELMQMRRKEVEGIEMEAAQSWLAEGTATYCETNPLGTLNERWLFTYQEMVRKKETSPIEFFMVFKIGSFPGLAPKGMLNAYSQSWAFTTFLMNKYPDQFMEYHIKMVDQKPKDSDEELAWLLESVNKDLPTLEKEFREFMDSYEEIEDPYIRRFMQWREIWEDLY